MVIGPPAETAPATAIAAVVVLVTPLNSNVALELVPTVSEDGAICVPPWLTPNAVLLDTMMAPVPAVLCNTNLPAPTAVVPL
jgi:hypothetical protein